MACVQAPKVCNVLDKSCVLTVKLETDVLTQTLYAFEAMMNPGRLDDSSSFELRNGRYALEFMMTSICMTVEDNMPKEFA